MGLFDKKYCDICGKEIKLLGNRKLDDGNCCKDCAGKLSPWFTGRRHTSVEAIKRQLAYREENERNLDSFFPDKTIGSSTRVMIDSGNRKFIVTRSSSWRNSNPDIINISDVQDVQIKITEDQDEEYTKDESGHRTSYDPPKYSYEYDFHVVITVRHEFFDDISFDLQSTKPTSPREETYRKLVSDADEIMYQLTGRHFEEDRTSFRNPEAYEGESETAEETQTEAETETTPVLGENEWFCPNCGNRNDSKFCIKCGTAKPITVTVHFCPNCGEKIESADTKFCPKCGTRLSD